MKEFKSNLTTFSGDVISRLQMDVIDPDDESQFEKFVTDKSTQLPIPNTNKTIAYNSSKKTVIMKTSLGTSRAVSLGAYAYALYMLDK